MKLILFLFLLQDPSSWVEQLGSGSESRRWQAVEHLSKLGEKGAEVISSCKDAWWKEVALAEWSTRQKAGESYPQLVRLRLGLQSGEGARIAADLAEKAGVTLERRSLVSGDVVLDQKEGTWFELLSELRAKAELDIIEVLGGSYRIVPSLGGAPQRSLSRNYEFCLDSFIRTTNATFDSPPLGQTSFQFSVRADPQSQILRVESPQLIRGLFGSGEEMKQVDVISKSDPGRNRYRDSSSHSFEIAISPDGVRGKKIHLMQGKVQAVLPLKKVFFEFKPRMEEEDVRVEKEGVVALLHTLSYRNRRVTLSLTLSSSQEGVIFPADTRIQMLDDVGLPYRSYQRTSYSKSPSETKYEITYLNVRGKTDPSQIRFSVVTHTYTRPVFFSFRDIDLE